MARALPRVVRTVADFRALRPSLGRMGFVPTMGNLHAGHGSLVRQARRECESVAASIFVNPAQFAKGEDLDKYPRTLDADLRLLGDAGCDVVWVPPVEELYPAGIVLDRSDQQGTFVEVLGKSHQMEGTVRPHFFRGVATVVCKLFHATQPSVAYFGQKDAQQCVVIRNMVRDLLFDVQVVVGATVREPDGLAMSSRNGYLSPADRQAGLCLYRGLTAAQRLFDQGARDRSALHAAAATVIAAEPRVALQYVSIAHPRTLAELSAVGSEGAILSGAIMTTSTRLIDNVLLGVPGGL
jgi:pantoate--beta-alanine ligase